MHGKHSITSSRFNIFPYATISRKNNFRVSEVVAFVSSCIYSPFRRDSASLTSCHGRLTRIFRTVMWHVQLTRNLPLEWFGTEERRRDGAERKGMELYSKCQRMLTQSYSSTMRIIHISWIITGEMPHYFLLFDIISTLQQNIKSPVCFSPINSKG